MQRWMKFYFQCKCIKALLPGNSFFWKFPFRGKYLLFLLKTLCGKLIFLLTTVSQGKCVSPVYATYLCVADRQMDNQANRLQASHPAGDRQADRQTDNQLVRGPDLQMMDK